jgi:hypothetical protein
MMRQFVDITAALKKIKSRAPPRSRRSPFVLLEELTMCTIPSVYRMYTRIRTTMDIVIVKLLRFEDVSKVEIQGSGWSCSILEN